MRFSGLFSRPSFDTDTSSTFASVKLFFMRIRCCRDGKESSPLLLGRHKRRSTCFQINLRLKKMIHCSSIVCLEMWKSDSLCAHRYSLPREVFIYISSGCKFLLILSEFKNFYLWNTGWESHVLPAAFIPVRLRAFWPQGPRVEVEAQSALTGGTMNRVRSCQLSAQLPLLECK